MKALTHISVVTHASDGSEIRLTFAEGEKLVGVDKATLAKLVSAGAAGPDRKE